MGEFLGEVRIFSFNWVPRNWAMCNGQLMPINQNQALFSLLGTMYGGDGQVTFALPDLRSRIPMHIGNNSFNQGERAGQSAHTVTISELPQHLHTAFGTNATATSNLAPGFIPGNVPTANAYAEALANLTTIEPTTVASVGGSQPHNNMSPYLTLTFGISLIGVFPSRN